jgi:predicted DNA-binding transcriptional regulator AlpA
MTKSKVKPVEAVGPPAEVWHVRELAAYLGMTEEAVRTAVHRRLGSVPPGFKLGTRWAWLRSDVDAWLRRQAEK